MIGQIYGKRSTLSSNGSLARPVIHKSFISFTHGLGCGLVHSEIKADFKIRMFLGTQKYPGTSRFLKELYQYSVEVQCTNSN